MAPPPPTATITKRPNLSIALADTPYKTLAPLVPTEVNRLMEFEIKDANTSLANAIRRTLISEMPLLHLTVALSDIKTTDPYLLAEAIQKRVEMIPVAQSIDPAGAFSVQFESKSDECADVMSSEIRTAAGRAEGVHPSIPLCDINPQTSLSISNIRVAESYGFNNGRVTIGRVGFETINYDFGTPTLVAAPDQFRFQIETPSVLDPAAMTLRAIDGLIARLERIDYAKNRVEFGVFKLHIPDETYSIGRMLCWYVLRREPSTAYVACRIPHPSKRECFIDVSHPDAEKLCKEAARAAAEDLRSVRSAFLA